MDDKQLYNFDIINRFNVIKMGFHRDIFFKIVIYVGFLISLYSVPAETFLRIAGGYGIRGSGNIINSSGKGLELIETAVNNELLISPTITPFVQTIGPYYRLSDFRISSYSFDLQIGKRNTDAEYGLSINYFDLAFDLRLPDLFIDTKKFIPNSEVYLPFSDELKGRSLLASVVQLEGFYNYFLWQYNVIKFFLGFGAGMGNGKLAYSGPYVNEIHANLNLGILYQHNGWEFFVNLKNSGYTAKSGPSNLIDRRKVLVNPRKGEIVISSLQLGFTFLLTHK